MLPQAAYFQLSSDLRICRLINGMWQVSGTHGAIDPRAAINNMSTYHADGMSTWDLADHYGAAEDFIGIFRKQLDSNGQSTTQNFQAFTKWVPRPMPMPRAVVEQALSLSRRRMATQILDMVQFHWWDYKDTAYLDALEHMAVLRDQRWMRHIGLTNFDTERVRTITEHGIRIISNQIQYSIIDRRPEVSMIDYCRDHKISLLTYGTVCGGLLSEKYIDVQEPGYSSLNTASLRKYKHMIDQWGGWALFQELLRTLKAIAEKHNVTIPNVAVRYILDKPTVAGVIIGARLGISDHRAENLRVFSFALDDEDIDAIHAISDQSRNLYDLVGDCGDEYRR